jgi:perosamine synthetase
VTNNPQVAEKSRILRDHGMSPERKYWHPVLGYNYRMTNLQAALGVAQMERVDQLIAAKRQIAGHYGELLANIPGISLPPEADWARNVYWLYTVLVDEKAYGSTREELMAELARYDMDTRPAFPCIHQQPIYNTGEHFPVAEMISVHGINLPTAASLRADEVQKVAGVIAAFARRKAD